MKSFNEFCFYQANWLIESTTKNKAIILPNRRCHNDCITFPSIAVYFSNKWNTIFIFLIYHDILIQERATLTYFVHLFLYLCCIQTFFHYISKDGLEYKFPVQMKNIVSNVHVKSEHNQITDFQTIFSWNSFCSTNSCSFIYKLLIIHSTGICCLY